MLLSVLAGLVVSVDALFIGISLGLQEKCKYIYLVIINIFLLALCFVGFFIAAEVYELIPIDPDYIVGFAFIGLGLYYILNYLIKSKKNNKNEIVKENGIGTIATIGAVMSLEAMIITMGITFVFMPYGTIFIPLTVALAHFIYSSVCFFLVRTKYISKMPLALSHYLSGAGLIIYGLMALLLEIEIY